MDYLEQFAAVEETVIDANDYVTRNGSIDPEEAAQRWKQADDAVSQFVDWTYDGARPGKEEQLAADLQEKQTVLKMNMMAADRSLQDQGYSIDEARRSIDPHYGVMRTAAELVDTADELDSLAAEYQDVLDAYEDGNLTADEATDVLDVDALYGQSNEADVLQERTQNLLHEREHTYAAGTTGYMQYDKGSQEVPDLDELEEERNTVNSALAQYSAAQETVADVTQRLDTLFPQQSPTTTGSGYGEVQTR